MPNELTPQEIVEKLLYLDSHIESDNDIRVLSAAASIVRQYANGELRLVVHCKKCEFWENDGVHICGMCRNPNVGSVKMDTDFCSFGVRKDGAE
nr:MAG TPA: hypothetical protein [Caudoviricetes sp.]